jgi:V8-like Glu-specific endopeptidase
MIDLVHGMEYDMLENPADTANNTTLTPSAFPVFQIIGDDTRVLVNKTSAFPFHHIGRLARGCTATIVGPFHILTAGHCVYDQGTWSRRLAFTDVYGRTHSYK